MTKNSERQVATDAPDPFVDGFVTAVPEREYQSKQLLNPPLKTAAGNPAGNSGAMPNQTGAGSNGVSGSLTLATGGSASCYAGDITASVGPTDCATGGGVFTRTSGIVSTGASGNAVLTARASGGDNCGLSVMAASFSMVSELKYQSK